MHSAIGADIIETSTIYVFMLLIIRNATVNMARSAIASLIGNGGVREKESLLRGRSRADYSLTIH